MHAKNEDILNLGLRSTLGENGLLSKLACLYVYVTREENDGTVQRFHRVYLSLAKTCKLQHGKFIVPNRKNVT